MKCYVPCNRDNSISGRSGGKALISAKLTIMTCLLSFSFFAHTQEGGNTEYTSNLEIEEVVVTGTRIRKPGLISASPIFSLDAEEIGLQQQADVERILRDLPSTIPRDGENVNNGSAGIASIDLRGLGARRTLTLLNGRRMIPANHNGIVDTSIIPTALIKRIDIITGGASAVYGSDALSGAVNFILNDEFEGVDIAINHALSGESDVKSNMVALTLGSKFADDRGHFAMNVSWAERDAVLLGQRKYGKLGISTKSGKGYSEYLAGQDPESPMAGCTGPDAAKYGGSTTSIPTRVSIAGAGNVGQFLNNRTLYTGDADGAEKGYSARGGCSVFNYNPVNYFKSPQERYNIFSMAKFEVNDHLEVYSTAEYSNISVRLQIAPSGTFGARFNVPLANPYISASALTEIISVANDGVAKGNLEAGGAGSNWNDVNKNGVVDKEDYLKMQLRRRTVELGPRSSNWSSDHFSFLVGARGDIAYDWRYDVSFQHGRNSRVQIRDGYTNLTNIQNALDATSKDTCKNGVSSCVPIDLFGGYGTITSKMAGYARAIASLKQTYEQTIMQGILDGPIEAIQMPTASSPLALSLGYEYRDESAELIPDECLKLAPASCQGGAGGNLLPIAGGYDVAELFFEGMLPLINDRPFMQAVDMEFGYRQSDYSTVGKVHTNKFGLNWRLDDTILFRAMKQRATRAPNVAELYSPLTTGLDNANQDPCSVANKDKIDAKLKQLCISTGMLPGQVGLVQDIVSDQINVIEGSDPANPPEEETASTTTVGMVWTPDLGGRINDFSVAIDYYNIDIQGYIDEYSAQQTLDQCYKAGRADVCALIRRVDGDLTSPSSGIELYTRNLDYIKTSGVELSWNAGFDLNRWGSLRIGSQINSYLKNKTRSDSLSPEIDCNGYYGTNCAPTSKTRMVTRATWTYNRITASLRWRYLSGVAIERSQAAKTYAAFREIDSYSYFDLFAGYTFFDDRLNLSLGIENITDKEPPIVGNGAGSTASNSGNTFPSAYSVYGRMFKLGMRMTL